MRGGCSGAGLNVRVADNPPLRTPCRFNVNTVRNGHYEARNRLRVRRGGGDTATDRVVRCTDIHVEVKCSEDELMTLAHMATIALGLAASIIGGVAQSTTPPSGQITMSTSGSTLSIMSTLGRQAHIPMGIIIGSDYERLCRTSGSFSFQRTDTTEALRRVAGAAGYTLTQENGTQLITAADAAPWEQDVLDHQVKDFTGFHNATMAQMGMAITGIIAMDVAHVATFAASVLSSPSDRRVSVPAMKSVSIRDLAEHVVSLDEGGMWLMKPRQPNPRGPQDITIEIISYHDRPDESSRISCGPVVSQ